jgi:hypothetical protein
VLETDRHDRKVIAPVAPMIRALGSEHGFDVVIVIHPDRQEAMLHRYNQQVILLLDTLKHRSDLNLIDVLERWKTSAAFVHQSAESLYWPIDGHNNVEGYALIAKAVADGLGSMHLGTTHGFRRRTKPRLANGAEPPSIDGPCAMSATTPFRQYGDPPPITSLDIQLGRSTEGLVAPVAW